MKIAGARIKPGVRDTYFEDASGLFHKSPSRTTKQWLGMSPYAGLCVDWPADLCTKGGVSYWVDYSTRSLIALNDSTSLTLPQIGDLMAYFGVVER
jgi:hypothetical protein